MAIIRRAPLSDDVSNSRIVVSVALIVGLAAIIGCLMWVKRRIRNATPVATLLEHLPSSEAQPRKGIESYMLDSIPVIVYRASLESDEQEGLSNIGGQAGGEPGDEPLKGVVTVQAEVKTGEMLVKKPDVSIQKIDKPPKEEAARVTERNGSRQDSKICSICTEDFVEGRNVRILPCRHIYHRRCIDPWLLGFAGTCPLCRIALGDLVPTSSQPPRPPDPVVLASETLPVPAGAPLFPIYSLRRVWRSGRRI